MYTSVDGYMLCEIIETLVEKFEGKIETEEEQEIIGFAKKTVKEYLNQP